MTEWMYVTIVPEGQLEDDALRQLIAHSCPEIVIMESLLIRKNPNRETKAPGRDSIRLNAKRYRNAAEKGGISFILLCDLESNYTCAPELLADWSLAVPMPDKFIFNIAVRSTEAWLMADQEKIAQFLSVSSARIPTKPDEIDQPKKTLIGIARQSSDAGIRKAFMPQPKREVGFGYIECMRDYIQNHWRIDNAADASPSLSRALDRLRQIDRPPQNEPNA